MTAAGTPFADMSASEYVQNATFGFLASSTIHLRISGSVATALLKLRGRPGHRGTGEVESVKIVTSHGASPAAITKGA